METESMQMVEEDIINDLKELDDRMSQYTFLTECGMELPDFPEQLRTDDNLIRECQVHTWIHTEWKAGRLHFLGDSESLIIRGAILLLMEIYDGRTGGEIQCFSGSLLDTDCFRVHYTQEQIYGLKNVITKLSALPSEHNG